MDRDSQAAAFQFCFRSGAEQARFALFSVRQLTLIVQTSRHAACPVCEFAICQIRARCMDIDRIGWGGSCFQSIGLVIISLNELVDESFEFLD
jgi:hypothetical protein